MAYLPIYKKLNRTVISAQRLPPVWEISLKDQKLEMLTCDWFKFGLKKMSIKFPTITNFSLVK